MHPWKIHVFYLLIFLTGASFWMGKGEVQAWLAKQQAKSIPIAKVPIHRTPNPTPSPSMELGKMDKEIHAKLIPFPIRSISKMSDPYLPAFFSHPVSEVLKLPPSFTYDKEGVVVQKEEGKVIQHPVKLAQMTILFVETYELTKEKAYLERAKKQANRLHQISVKQGDALFFPYHHDHLAQEIENMKAPWVSGMSQGQALSAFVRLYQVTKEKKYLEWADQTFNSLTQTKGKQKYWVSMVDKHGYYWIEEYPAEQPLHVLNGFIFATYGVYDYYQETKNPLAKKILQASMTTVLAYIDRYRNEGEPSEYGLKYSGESRKYHPIHTRQLFQLYRITQDERFKEKSEQFLEDCGCTLPKSK